MDVSEIRMTILDRAGATKAIGSVTFNGEFAIRGVRVMENADGRNFISFPSRQRADGQYEDIAFPLTKELYHKVSDAVIKEYNAQKEKKQEAEKDAFIDVAKMAEQNPDAVFMDTVAPMEEGKSEGTKARKGRGR
ncbi:MAG: SpoVG family protein [Lachnospiraceae bacterium]|nr:SpoVG family protein [Lachnospiraceae bacterium]